MYKKVDPGQDFRKLELSILEFWDKERCFEKLLKKNEQGPFWSFIDGPITANNPMGVHHAWGRSLKDVFQRHRAMLGFKQRFQNGFDCQGLHVEVETEKALGFTSKKDIEEYGIARFALKCRERVLTFADLMTKQSIRLGQWMNWDDSYYTMSDSNIEHIWHFLKKCGENGWLYQDNRPLPWCSRCGTSLSQHELADNYQDTSDLAIFVRFPLVDSKNEHLLVWTTTPWTLTSNIAAAVNPELNYLKVKKGEDTYYLADVALKILGADTKISGRVKGSEMVGWKYEGPFDDLPAQKEIVHRIIPWDEVSAEEGSGIVHIAPGCGAEDYELGKKYNLPTLVPIDESGIYKEGFGWLKGRDVQTVASDILKDLKAKGVLMDSHQYLHRYPFCWRCHQPLVFRVEEEWFINCDEIRNPMKEAALKVNWMPESVGKRVQDWYNNMGDWCISRKRFWGLPLPFYICKEGHLTIIGSRDELVEKAVNQETAKDIKELHLPWIDEVLVNCDSCGEEAVRVRETGDCWLDAGIVPFSTQKYLYDKEYWKEWFPTEFICEMREQVRLWFYSMMFMSVTLEQTPPYLNVLSYEKLLDEHGKPMHKSTGNAIWFDDAIEKMGADVMRWIYCAQNPSFNLRFGYTLADETRRKLLTLWNTYSFYVTYAAIDNYHPQDSENFDSEELTLLDRWIFSCLNTMVDEANRALTVYDTPKALKAVEKFLNNLSNWYIRRSRRRFWKSENDGDKQAAYFTLFRSLETLSKVLAPICPFITEEIYCSITAPIRKTGNQPASVHLCDYPVPDHSKVEKELEAKMELLLRIVNLARAARQKAKIKVRQPLSRLSVFVDGNAELGDELSRQVLEELNVKAIEFREDRKNFAKKEIKIDFSQLGGKYGKDVQTIASGIKKGNFSENDDGSITTGLFRILPEEFQTILSGVEPFIISYDKDIMTALDTTLTPELKKEGMGRELVRYIQELRKAARLEVSDKIMIYFATDSDTLDKSLLELNKYICEETLADTIRNSRVEGVLAEKEFKVYKNRIWLGIERI